MVAVGDGAADGGWGAALGVAEAAANAKAQSRRGLYFNCAEHSRKAAAAGVVGDDAGLGIVELLELEQRVAAPAAIARVAALQHQPFAAGGYYFVQPRHQRGAFRKLAAAHPVQVLCIAGFDHAAQCGQSLVKGLRWIGQIECHEAQFAPAWVRRFPRHNGGGALKAAAPRP